MEKNFIIPLVIYPFDAMVSLGETDKELKISLKKMGAKWDSKMKLSGVGRYFMNQKNQSLNLKTMKPTRT